MREPNHRWFIRKTKANPKAFQFQFKDTGCLFNIHVEYKSHYQRTIMIWDGQHISQRKDVLALAKELRKLARRMK